MPDETTTPEPDPIRRVGSPEWLEEVFIYHAPSASQAQAYTDIRTYAKELACIIIASCPACADRTAALRKLRECVMTANAAIALDGLV
jgi:hypothetical protein